MNILVVASKFPPEYSGPGVRIPRLYKTIGGDLAIHSVQVLCGGIEHTENEIYYYEGMEVRRVVASYIRCKKFPFNFLPPRIFEVIISCVENILGYRVLRHYKDINLVHIFGTSGITAAAIHWAVKNNIPIFQELVTAKASPQQRWLVFGKAKPAQNSIIVTMQDDAQARCTALGYTKQIWHRPNPFNQNDFFAPDSQAKNKLRSELTPFSSSDIVLVSVAKFMPQKNQLFLLNVLDHLGPEFKLVIAGPTVVRGPLQDRDKNYIDSIQTKIHDRGWQNRVHMVTSYVESNLYMKAGDIYMLPAYDEGFGTPMIEAVACGLPVVANAGEASFNEWLREGENGFLRPLEPAAWAEAIRLATSLPAEQRLMEAKKIAILAGQDIIYNQYVEKIKSLTKQQRSTL